MANQPRIQEILNSGLWASKVFRDPGTPLTREQKILREKVYKQILYRPDEFDMSNWNTVLPNACGTSRCVAGWAVALSGVTLPSGEVTTSVTWEALGIELLGLTYDEYAGEHEERLFYTGNDDALVRMKALAEAS